jgi:iron complex outermembrane receptor protein
MRFLITVAALAALATPAFAQRADDNAVKSADDAFGTSVGNETIGLYNPYEVRGFSAIDAGNVRIDGLYFDRQTDPTQLISPGNSMRVGISAQGYPLPAPTGIVDYELVRVGDTRVVSVVGGYGPFGATFAEVDAKLPLVPGRFGVALGAAYTAPRFESGVTERDVALSVAAQWRPTDRIEIIPFFGRTETRDSEAAPLFFVGGPYLPPRVKRGRFTGQDWADNEGVGTNYGLVSTIGLAAGWTARAGIFHSQYEARHQFADLFLDTTEAGVGQHLIIADPPARFASTSGELRLSRTFDAGPTRNTVHLIVRGRDQHRRYGGSDVLDFGPAQIGVPVDLPEPVFAFGPQTRDEVRQWTGALAYQGRLGPRLEVTAGLQRTRYRKTVTEPGGLAVMGRDNAWLYNVAGAFKATDRLAFYGSYTTGLEEGGVAPPNAINKDAAPPAIHTKQLDAGLRYAIAPQLRLVAGVFDVRKPYYSLDGASLYRLLGEERHQGIELSLSGQLAKGLNVVAGTVLMRPRVSGEEVDAGLIGKIPVAQLTRLTIVAADYQIPQVKGLSVSATLQSISSRQASLDNRLSIPARNVLDVAARYRFEVAGAQASVRVAVGNVFDKFGWRTNGSAVFTTNAQRRYSVTVAADF